ncbi:hypothetical protein [Aeromonas jandaei]|uniref:hypothetical protein n=1 Tax=Aeromonas jandaei TaxID=650 RepID=UPI003BA3D26E
MEPLIGFTFFLGVSQPFLASKNGCKSGLTVSGADNPPLKESNAGIGMQSSAMVRVLSRSSVHGSA